METSQEEQRGQEPEDQPGEPGAESGSGTEDAEALPASPTRGDSAAGDTDQHSSA